MRNNQLGQLPAPRPVRRRFWTHRLGLYGIPPSVDRGQSHPGRSSAAGVGRACARRQTGREESRTLRLRMRSKPAARPDVRGRSVRGSSRFPVLRRKPWLHPAGPASHGRALPATQQPLSSPRPAPSVPYMRLCAPPRSRTTSGAGVSR